MGLGFGNMLAFGFVSAKMYGLGFVLSKFILIGFSFVKIGKFFSSCIMVGEGQHDRQGQQEFHQWSVFNFDTS